MTVPATWRAEAIRLGAANAMVCWKRRGALARGRPDSNPKRMDVVDRAPVARNQTKSAAPTFSVESCRSLPLSVNKIAESCRIRT